MTTKFHTLTIEADPSRLFHLRQAVMVVPEFGQFDSHTDTRSALLHIEKKATPEIQIVFLSHTLPEDELAFFIRTGKEVKATQDSAFVLIIPSTDDMKTQVARFTLIGIDGILAEPYSVDSLVDITKLSLLIKKKRSAEREIKAIHMMMTEIAEQVNKIAVQRRMGVPTTRDMKRLTTMCEVIEELDESTRERYLECAVDVFETASLPKELMTCMYKGVSARTKKRMEAKLKAKLEAEQQEKGE